jgi:hypothetical protein
LNIILNIKRGYNGVIMDISWGYNDGIIGIYVSEYHGAYMWRYRTIKKRICQSVSA